MNFDNIPAELKALNQWVCWSLVERDGKPTKLPVNANTGKLASSTNKETWASFETAVAASRRYNGIGFVFSEDDPYFGVDLDGQIDMEIVDWFGTYCERSQSGTGAHIIGKGKLNRKGAKITTGDHVGYEVYDRGRYFVVTGDIIHPEPIRECQAQLDEFVHDVFPADKGVDLSRFLPTHTPESGQDILDRIRDSAQGGKFDVLWAGNWQHYYGSQSEADAALMSILRFWTGGNMQESIALFRQSGLMRKKAERKDYLVRTYAGIDSGEVYVPLEEMPDQPAPSILKKQAHSPWRKVTIDHVQRAIEGTILQPMCEAICAPTNPPLPLEVGLVKALGIAGCALSQKRDKPRGLGDYIAKGADLARVRIMTAGGQVCNFYGLLVGRSASGKDVGNMVPKAAMQFKWLIGDAGSEEGIADAYISKPNGLLTISEMLNFLDARHWQAKAANFLTGIFNRYWFSVNLSKRSDAMSRETDYCAPNIIASVQPGVLQDFATKVLADSGFLGRFLVAEMPADFLAYPRSAALDDEVNTLIRCIKVLAAKEGDVFPPERYQEALSVMFSEHKAEPYTSWKRLCNEYYPRFALILSIPADDTTKAVQITQDGWDRAAVLVQYFFKEAERVFGGLHFDVKQAKFETLCDKILNFVKSRPGQECLRRDVSRNIGKGSKSKDRQEAIVELVNRGLIDAVNTEKGGVILKFVG